MSSLSLPALLLFLAVVALPSLEAMSVWDKNSANQVVEKEAPQQVFDRSARLSAYLRTFGGRSRLSNDLKGRNDKRMDWGDGWYKSEYKIKQCASPLENAFSYQWQWKCGGERQLRNLYLVQLFCMQKFVNRNYAIDKQLAESGNSKTTAEVFCTSC
jgi:hypothetical protein